MEVFLVGAPGRSPFNGYFRLHGEGWGLVGRLAPSGTIADGWAAAELARDLFAGLADSEDRLEYFLAARAVLPEPLAERGDTALLFVMATGEGTTVVHQGLSTILVHGKTGLPPLFPPGHPAWSAEGVPVAANPSSHYFGIPAGQTAPAEGEILLRCGARG